MSEEFQGGICGGSSWWINPSTNLFRSSPCASTITGPGSFEWLSHDQPKTASDDSGSTGSLVLNMDHEDNWNQNLMMNDSNHILLPQSYSTNTMDNINNYSSQFSSSYGSYDNSSPVFQTLFNADSQPHQQLQQSTNYFPCPEYLSPAGFRPNKIDSNLHFANDAAFWNGKAPNFLPPNPQPLPYKHKRTNQESKKANEPSSKRSRMEAPTPLPTIKVRKEKLGDRITALQQLVSPFGKTDTASVLHEAIEYIKFLHEQVGVLSTPYLKNGSNRQHDHQRARDETRDLRSLGLCLVPIPATFPVAGEASADFWTPTFGGCFR